MADGVTLTTSDGETLEAELSRIGDPRAMVVITHPHPLMGGDMHTPVPDGFFRAAASVTCSALRFNFRGVGRSTGTHDEGGAERLDVAAAIALAADQFPGLPIILAGWSFGADVSLTVDDDQIAGWFLAAPPLRVVDPAEMAAAELPAPKTLAIGENDQFNPPASATKITADWQSTSIEVIAGADHFFGPQLPELVDAFRSFVEATVGS